jgi:hypothetical protein
MNRFLVAVLVATLLTPLAVSAQTGDDKLTQGIRAYNELELEAAVTLLNEALQLGLSETSQIEAYKYLGFCYIDTNRLGEARNAFDNLLKLNPAYTLDPNLPPKYLNPFNAAKAAMPKTGSIFVQSDPASAEIFLDNAPRGQTPQTLSDVLAGRHSLKLTLNGYADVERTINVEVGKRMTLDEKLRRLSRPEPQPATPESKPIQTVKQGSSLPWIIIGGAVVVGGGVAAALLLSGGGDDAPPGSTSQTASLTISLQFP